MSAYLSKSQIETWNLCQRRWYFKYIERRTEPPTKYTAFGIAAHELAEHYLRGHELPAPNSLTFDGAAALESLRAGVKYAPAPGTPGLEVEKEFTFELGGIRYGGRKDYEVHKENITVVGDWKFVGGFKYALTPQTLPEDTQFLLYAFDAFERPGVDYVHGQWVYMQRGKASARSVECIVEKDYVDRGIAKICRIGDVIERTRAMARSGALKSANDLPPTPSACHAYGTVCSHVSVCDLTPAQKMVGHMKGNNTMTMNSDSPLAKILFPKVQNVAPVQVAPVTTGAGLMPEDPKYRVEKDGQVSTMPQSALASLPIDGSVKVLGVDEGMPVVQQIVPGQVVQLTTTPEFAPTIPALPADAPKKRGRPKGSTNKPKAVELSKEDRALAEKMFIAQEPESPEAGGGLSNTLIDDEEKFTISNSPTQEYLKAAVLRAAKKGPEYEPGEVGRTAIVDQGYMLLVGCYPASLPDGVKYTLASDYLRDVLERVRVDCQVLHYRMVDYGKGPGILAAYLAEKLEKDPMFSDTVILLDPRTPEGADTLATFERFASYVIRGV